MCEFEIPSGPASSTLKIFAIQAEIEILFDPQQVKPFYTQAVSGQFTPKQTLEMMLRNTALEFSIDPKTRAYAVIHSDPPDADPNPR